MKEKKFMLTRVFFFLLLLFFTSCDFYKVPVASMEPTIKQNASVKIDKSYYKNSSVQRFDIVGFTRPDNDQIQVKRVVGLPGEIIEIKGGDIFINNKKLDEPIPFDKSKDYPPYSIPEDNYFLLGDNR